MKKIILLISVIMSSLNAISQENMFTLAGGYSFANVKDIEINGTGWRINGLYEFNPAESRFAHGVSFGYISVSATEGTGQDYLKCTVNSIPIYYAPKIFFGNGKIRGFGKAALGMHFAAVKREGVSDINDNDFGFYGGAGVGGMLLLKENIFISIEYELAYVSNAWYKDKMMNTIGGGIGLRF